MDDAVPSGVPVATYPSFRMLEGGSSRVTLEVDRKVDVVEQKLSGRVLYKLRGTHTPGKVARLPLNTAFFASPVGRVELLGQADGATLSIDLREASEVQYRVIDTPRGIVLQVDFPPATTPAIRDQAQANGDAILEPERATRGTDTKRLGEGAGRGKKKGPAQKDPELDSTVVVPLD